MSSLSTTDHRRDSAGLIYVYPVLSRRSGGLSIGVNLNPNNACNWRCLYCQVPDLKRGSAPAIDLGLLRKELDSLLADVLRGDFYDRFGVPPEQRVIRDIAISGNGEPTSAAEFEQVVELIGEVASDAGLSGEVKRVLISNGSLTRRAYVQRGLERWNALGGEVWFKLDSATAAGIARINQVSLTPEAAMLNLESAATRCPTWLQTCWFALDSLPPSDEEVAAYLGWLEEVRRRGIPLRGILLYGLARPSQQPEAPRLSALPAAWMEATAERLRQTGFAARLSV
ncbi:radical SAM protein [Methylococcus sp. EFPC2]|uniref:radical SAM protein n=1 Tax=Methylococcus sp. EFPC2 TaxID=2812648 RepID=UPI0019687859|nr:radical SAM protein [Methylococcus sp. EFPC2]QSA96208.1 radical SAM protein [Methylococcus sp. EFPC2]